MGLATFDKEPADEVLTNEDRAFLESIAPRAEELVQEFGKLLIDIEKRQGHTGLFERDFKVDGRVVRFSVELMTDGELEFEALMKSLFCDCPECLGEQIELPLDEPKNENVN